MKFYQRKEDSKYQCSNCKNIIDKGDYYREIEESTKICERCMNYKEFCELRAQLFW